MTNFIPSKVAVPTMSDLYETKTPQTMWWMQRPDDGAPVHWPLALASMPIIAVTEDPCRRQFWGA